MTAEEFVDRPHIGPGTSDYGESTYDILRREIAKKLVVPTENVDIFTVFNHPSLPKTVDVRYSAHGSPYYHPSKLDGIVNQHKDEVGSMCLISFSGIGTHSTTTITIIII